MDLTFLPKVEIRSSEVTAGRLCCHTLLRNCPYPVFRKLSTHKNATSHSHCHWPGRAPAGPDHLCLLPGPSDANQEVRLLSQCVCEALPRGWKGECLHRSFWSTVAGVPRGKGAKGCPLTRYALTNGHCQLAPEQGLCPEGRWVGAKVPSCVKDSAGWGLYFIQVLKIQKWPSLQQL